jgi:hypothetical protein
VRTLASSVAEARAGRDRFDNLFALLNHLGLGAAGEVGAQGHTWDTLLTNQRWDLTRLYAEVALYYAWAGSRITGRLVRDDTSYRYTSGSVNKRTRAPTGSRPTPASGSTRCKCRRLRLDSAGGTPSRSPTSIPF